MASTLEEIIANTLDLLDRPDLLRVCRVKARDVLYAGHALADFHRDIERTALTTAEERTVIALPSNFRKERAVVAYGEDGAELPYQYNKKGVTPYIGYTGFVDNGFKYYLSGGSMHIQHYADLIPTSVAFYYYKVPSFSVNTETQAVSTDSWLVAQESYLTAAFFAEVCRLTGSNLLGVARADLAAAVQSLAASELEM